jgi:aminoacyl-tRNA hydrolase
MFVIAGLGNPEPRYARNRHNIGFEVVQAFAEAVGADPWRSKFQGEIARCQASNVDVLLVRPMTFMNRSGESLQAVMSFFRVPISDLLVVHDELDLPFGTLRLKPGGGRTSLGFGAGLASPRRGSLGRWPTTCCRTSTGKSARYFLRSSTGRSRRCAW